MEGEGRRRRLRACCWCETGQKIIIANALETGWQRVNPKTRHELFDVERHSLRLFAMFASVVLPLKRQLAIFERQQPMVGDRHTMCVAAQLFQRPLRSGLVLKYFAKSEMQGM